VICHGDFQPLNILADHGRLTGVIDWAKATIADPAFDYGAVLAIFATVPIRVPAGLHRALRALMNNLARIRVAADLCRKARPCFGTTRSLIAWFSWSRSAETARREEGPTAFTIYPSGSRI
jgi:hypothetical protein